MCCGDLSLESGRPLVEAQFDRVETERLGDVLEGADEDDVLAYLTSFPPGDRANETEIADLKQRIAGRFVSDDGVLRVTIETGVFVCRQAIPADPSA